MDDFRLGPEQRQALDEGRKHAASFSGAAKVAGFNGWTLGVFAALSIAFGLRSLPGFLVGVGLALVARNELVGRKRILDFDPAGFRLLWKNQIALSAIVVAYCLWARHVAATAPNAALDELDAAVGEGVSSLVRTILVAAFTVAIGATVVVQGLNALYYFVRIRRLESYLGETPGWVVELQRPSSAE